MIQNPQAISAEEVAALRKLLYQYPYFQLACTLIAKAAYDQDPTRAQQAIQLAAVYATDRSHLKLLLENKLPFAIPKKESLSKSIADTLAIPLSKEPIKEGDEKPDFINSYISTIRNRAEQKITKPKSLEQLGIIEAFMRKGGQFKPVIIKEMTLEESQVDLTQTCTTLHDDLITESLAQAMLKQGKFQHALGIYSKLKLRFPEKSLTFPPLPKK